MRLFSQNPVDRRWELRILLGAVLAVIAFLLLARLDGRSPFRTDVPDDDGHWYDCLATPVKGRGVVFSDCRRR